MEVEKTADNRLYRSNNGYISRSETYVAVRDKSHVTWSHDAKSCCVLHVSVTENFSKVTKVSDSKVRVSRGYPPPLSPD